MGTYKNFIQAYKHYASLTATTPQHQDIAVSHQFTAACMSTGEIHPCCSQLEESATYPVIFHAQL